MGSVNLPTVAEMDEIRNQINILIIIVIGGAGSVITAYFAALKPYITRRLKQQSDERQLQLKELEERINNQRELGKVDIERDRILPQLVATMQTSITSQSQFFQSVGAYLQNQVEQDNRRQAELHAHTIAVSGVAEGLTELRDEFSTLKGQIETVVTRVQFNTEATREATISSNLAAEQTKTTLELVTKFGLKLDTITLIAKSDTKPIPAVTTELLNDEEKKTA